MPDEPQMTFTSYIAGNSAGVAIYPDRIEWGRRGLKGGVTGLVLSSGLPVLAGTRKNTNMIPIRMIQGVTTHRAGFSYTTVKVATAGGVTEFRVTKAQAEQVRQLLLQLMNGSVPHAATPVPQAHPPGPGQSLPSSSASVADELRKLAELRDAGMLSDDELAAQKARLLG
jgi:Short C-terminal domain